MPNRQNQFKKLLKLITDERLRKSSVKRNAGDLLGATESDKGRVVNSASFRRLQHKAQVFPLDPNAAVRTRLTHSIEVSQIGRFLAQKVIEKCGVEKVSYKQLAAFANVVETACILHDIGNPPFGHLGESAIKEWASSKNSLNLLGDFESFDGNPQGLRLMSFLAGYDEFGLNLTDALLLSTIKYPWSVETQPIDKQRKKIGIYTQDYKNYKRCCKAVGWSKGKVFPVTRLMEAADDIAYSMSDLEDGIEKGIISIDDLAEHFKEFVPSKDEAEERGISSKERFITFKTEIIRESVDEAAGIFVDNLKEVLAGGGGDLISDENKMGGVVKKIKRYARKYIYSDSSAEHIELAGRSVIKGLLKHFERLLDSQKISAELFEALIERDMGRVHQEAENFDFEVRLLGLLPKSYCDHYKMNKRGHESIRRHHLIVDFIAGMTDNYALETFQMLEGIRVN